MAYSYQDPFTYASSARPVQAAPSFQNLMDEVRTQTAQTIARQQAAAAAQSLSLANARSSSLGTGNSTDSQGGGGGDYGGPSDRGGAPNSSSLNSSNSTVTGNYGGLGRAIGGVFGGPIGSIVGSVIGSNVDSRSYNGYGALDGTTTPATGPGTIGSRDNYGSNEIAPGPGHGPGPDANTNPASVSAVNGSDAQSDSYGGYGGDLGYGGDSGNTGDGAGGYGGSDNGYAKGGKIRLADIRHFTSGRPNRMGVDDGLAAAEAGEFILTAQRTKQIGAAALKALIDGRATIVLKGTK